MAAALLTSFIVAAEFFGDLFTFGNLIVLVGLVAAVFFGWRLTITTTLRQSNNDLRSRNTDLEERAKRDAAELAAEKARPDLTHHAALLSQLIVELRSHETASAARRAEETKLMGELVRAVRRIAPARRDSDDRPE